VLKHKKRKHEQDKVKTESNFKQKRPKELSFFINNRIEKPIRDDNDNGLRSPQLPLLQPPVDSCINPKKSIIKKKQSDLKVESKIEEKTELDSVLLIANEALMALFNLKNNYTSNKQQKNYIANLLYTIANFHFYSFNHPRKPQSSYNRSHIVSHLNQESGKGDMFNENIYSVFNRTTPREAKQHRSTIMMSLYDLYQASFKLNNNERVQEKLHQIQKLYKKSISAYQHFSDVTKTAEFDGAAVIESYLYNLGASYSADQTNQLPYQLQGLFKYLYKQLERSDKAFFNEVLSIVNEFEIDLLSHLDEEQTTYRKSC
jgi:hypothetical protein